MTKLGGSRWLAALFAAAMIVAPATAQIRTVDPNSGIDADLAPPPARGNVYYDDTPAPSAPQRPGGSDADADLLPPGSDGAAADPAPPPAPAPRPATDPYVEVVPPPAQSAPARPAGSGEALRQQASAATYKRDDLIAAAEGVFGRGAEGLAGLIENILRDQGEPNAYIAGREASAAFIVGLRYGSGTLFHSIEGQRPAYWTGPSVGFDVGGNGAQTFVLVYNLYDTQDLYKRFPAGEGNAYLVGGFTASYLRRGDVVLIPIRLGVGWRLGVNAGYMRFTDRQNWVPF